MPISLGFWEWGCPYHCHTALTNHNSVLHRHLNFPYTAKQSVFVVVVVVRETSAEILYWWGVTTDQDLGGVSDWLKQISLMARPIRILPKSVKWRVISMESLRSFLRRLFSGKPFVASRKVGYFLRLICSPNRIFPTRGQPMILDQNLTWFYRPFFGKKGSQKCLLKRQETRNHWFHSE